MSRSNSIVFLVLSGLFLYFGFGREWGYVSGDVWQHLTFHFAHANIFHWMCNAYCLYLILTRRNDEWWWWIVSYVLATLASFAIPAHNPVMGFSGVLCAFVGMTLSNVKKISWKNVAMAFLYLAIGTLFMRDLAVLLHFASMALGFGAGWVSWQRKDYVRTKQMNKILDDEDE